MAPNKPLTRFGIHVWLPLLLGAAVAAGMLIGIYIAGPQASLRAGQEYDIMTGNNKLEELIRYIEAKYVDEVDRKKLVDEAITSILHQLDPHSSYIPPEELPKINEQMEGQFLGIGVEFMILNDTVVVVNATDEGPAKKAGILAGDKLVTVNDSIIAGKNLNNNDVVQLLRGEEGTSVRIGIQRFPATSLRTYTLTRERIPIKSVDAAYLIQNKVAYIRINRFSANTDKEFLAALETLAPKTGGLDLILDLRHNPGGYLQQASNILSQIFPERGQLLVYTEGRAVNRSDYLSTGRAFFKINKVAVLIDEGSASASEILAGAIQDHDRGTILGRRSFGKGLVQEQYRMYDGSAVRLTVARYFTPSGRSIQKPYKDQEAYEQDVDVRIQNGELISPNRIAIADSTRYYTSTGRVVYSGGGIIPDIFVPADSLDLSPVFREIRNRIPEFALKVITELKPETFGKDAMEFVRSFDVSEAILRDFQQQIALKKIEVTPSDWLRMRERIRLHIKAAIGRDIFGVQTAQRILNEQDEAVQMAIRKLKEKQ